MAGVVMEFDMGAETPRGGTKWAPSSVKNLIDRAKRSGLIDDAETEMPG